MSSLRGFRSGGVWLAAALLGWTAAQAQPQPMALGAPEQRILVQVRADQETTLASPMTGRIVGLVSGVGERFPGGAVLAAFDCTEQQARLRIAQAELSAAGDNLEAKLRLKALESASDIEISTASAAVAKGEASLALARHQVGQCQVVAPFAGSVVRVAARNHQTVTTGQPLLEIISSAAPKLRISAHSRHLMQLRVGMPLAVTIEETRRTYSAIVTAVNTRVDPVNQSVELEARLRGFSPELMPGMTGTAVVDRGREPAERSR
jgi:membrane fusion protein (multidrug efflux system)